MNIYSRLTEEEKRIYNSYKNDDLSFKLNEQLRFGDIINYMDEVKLLDSIIDKSEFNNDCLLFRATVERDVIPFINEGIYVNPEYLSTSTKASGIKSFFNESIGAVFLMIYCSKGIKFTDLEANEENSKGEHEILLGRQNEFKVYEDSYITDKKVIKEIAGWKGHDIDKIRKIVISTYDYKFGKSPLISFP
ncbi:MULTISPECIES: ADP-ribosyltransferase [unclassified Arcicella]|uniref:ADP-ribosyltransferase n=1 Tax=unclassified Arcicella TaxID=2644986 RepID=UPI0028604653|nr:MULTISPECIES: ADP-ribosyltransferase [unclassified Arcicella]MDR6561157.1 hypothetical protein [Arcicella sp. BE51]MDR6811041.1 hypothetical protein [Arcicella sp. BE140]MDR6822391.1 hypothetical protein [Arcicella sp. BE139]